MPGKRESLGFDSSDSDAGDSEPELKRSRRTKVVFKPLTLGEEESTTGDELDKCHRQVDYLTMSIEDDESKKPDKPRENTTMSHAERTLENLRRPLFGQIVDDQGEHQVIRPIATKSRGLSIMEKMGFKVGDALGKDPQDDTALREPIAVSSKTDREGIRDGLRKGDVDKALSPGITLEDEKSFQKRLQHDRDQQHKHRLVEKLQRLCYELVDGETDIYKAKARDLNVMWRGYVVDVQRRKKTKDTIDAEEHHGEAGDYDEDDTAQIDTELQLFNEEPLDTKLSKLSRHLRANFNYCFWCGVQYDSPEDLFANCPGECESDHI